MADSAGNRRMDARGRLAELAEAQGISLAALSRMIGRNGTYLQQFITKGSPRRLAEDDRRLLAEFFAVEESELGGGSEKSYAPNRRHDPHWVEIPRLAVDASAGPGAFAANEQPFGSFRFSAPWLRQYGLEAARLSAISVAGDSMEPVLHDGDEILVDTTPRPLRDGIHVLRLGDALHVKRIQAGRPGMLTLISENSAYPPIEIALNEAEVIGRVVWKGGRL